MADPQESFARSVRSVARESSIPPESSRPSLFPSSRSSRPCPPWIADELEKALPKRAASEPPIGTEDLKKLLDIRCDFLAARLLKLFDSNQDGYLERAELFAGIQRLIFGSTRVKLELAFKIHDLNGDGAISFKEVVIMIALGLEAEAGLHDPRPLDEDPKSERDKVEEIRQQAKALAKQLFDAADLSRDALISHEEFVRAVARHRNLLKLVTESEARLLENPDALGRARGKSKQRSSLERARRYVHNNRSLVLTMTALFAVHGLAFAWGVYQHRQDQYSPWIQIARGGGACLKLDGGLVFLPVMRKLVDWLRGRTWARALPVDDAPLIHRTIGHALFVSSLVHTAAHLGNYAVSPAFASVWDGLTSRHGQTGLAALAVTLFMWALALPAIRRKRHFQLFWVSHAAFVAWALLAILHGSNPLKWSIIVPFALFLVFRAYQSKSVIRTTIEELDSLHSGVTRLALAKPEGFAFSPGDYVRVRIPALAKHEWHPFTISSAPERSNFTLHVRSLGDWTRSLRELARKRAANGEKEGLEAHIDGPYGTASGRIFQSKYAILVGAGIGVTPFASVLESLLLRREQGNAALEKAHFFWLNRDSYSFEWFAGLILELEAKDREKRVDIHVHMTGAERSLTAAALNLARDISHTLSVRDLETGLRTRTELGAPDWAAELTKIRERHAPEPVDLFFCGPPGLGRKLRAVCAKLGIRYYQEEF